MRNVNNVPLVMRVDFAKSDIAQEINNIMEKYQVPYYFLQQTMEEIAEQFRTIARNELIAQQTAYAKFIAEESRSSDVVDAGVSGDAKESNQESGTATEPTT